MRWFGMDIRELLLETLIAKVRREFADLNKRHEKQVSVGARIVLCLVAYAERYFSCPDFIRLEKHLYKDIS